MDAGFVNRISNSALITLDLENFRSLGKRVVYDIKVNLFKELVLREKDFREFLKTNDWSQYTGQNVAIICSVDAVIPTWAYMLLAAKFEKYANRYVFGGLEELELQLYMDAICNIDFESYRDAKVIIKGCGKFVVPLSVYVEIMHKLLPIASSIMYGEPCSTVPLFKKQKNI